MSDTEAKKAEKKEPAPVDPVVRELRELKGLIIIIAGIFAAMMGYFAFQSNSESTSTAFQSNGESTSTGQENRTEQWEYKVIGVGDGYEKEMERMLSKYGADGWETCGSWLRRGENYIVMKRRTTNITGSTKSLTGNEAVVAAVFVHMNAISKLFKDNTGDCDKAVAEVTGYTEKHKAELTELKNKRKEMNKTMSAEDKAKFEETVKKMAEEMVTGDIGYMVEFGSKCPSHMEKLSEAMSFLKTE
jgi:hypothetical protein